MAPAPPTGDGSEPVPDRPLWLTEERWLLDLLGWFVTRLDQPRLREPTRRISKRSVPALYDFSEDTRYRWQLLESLARDYRLLGIHFDTRIEPHQERYHNAQLRLQAGAEPTLRAWLDRPRVDPIRQAWQHAVAQHADSFADRGAALLAGPPVSSLYPPEEVVAGLARLGALLDDRLSLRELSARCFRGDSKFLDGRHDLLGRLFGERANAVLPRPLLLTAWAPHGFERLLIVENQDSFLRLADCPPTGWALLYSGGFRASAARLTSAHTRFACLPGSDADFFRAQWYCPNLPCFFWGDLDFAGMGILAALRQSLPRLEAWRPGYSALATRLAQGDGHSPTQAGKEGQQDPGRTGCPYADNELLPLLRRTGRCLDQEAVDAAQLVPESAGHPP